MSGHSAKPSHSPPQSTAAGSHQAASGESLSQRFGITEENLRWRRQFLGLGDEDRSILSEFAGWARSVAPALAKEFYEWQFNFEPTRRFFDTYAKGRGMSLDILRQHLEEAQAGYFAEAFEGARSNWGVEYFERRLRVGKLHDKINLPMKWYLGSYPAYQELAGRYIQRDVPGDAKVQAVKLALGKVFNLDMQAIADSFLLSTLESMGFNMNAIRSQGDRTEFLHEIKDAIGILVEQVKALSVGDVNHASFKLSAEHNLENAGVLFTSIARLFETIKNLIRDMNQMADEHNRGDIDVQMPVNEFQGAYQQMATGVNEMVAGHILLNKKAMSCVAEFGKGNLRAPLERFPGKKAFINETVEQIRDNMKAFVSDVSNNSSTLAGAAEKLSAVSQQMSGNADETEKQANVASTASSLVSENVATVASGAEQMQASIQEIAKNANQAARVAKNAVQVAQSTNLTVSKLGDSSQEIGKVIKVITSIAQQTNLLALNATIEAARAGEAGKGFAVVAHEVKELAKQTAKATDEISRKIETIQGDSKETLHAIGEIGSIINQINDISNSIASAVEEQTVTTNEISRSVNEAALRTTDISKSILGVATTAKYTTQGASETRTAAQELSRMAGELQAVVAKYTI